MDPHRDPDRHQNRAYNRLSLVTHPIPPERNLLKFVDTYLSYPANGQTNKGKNITSLAKVISKTRTRNVHLYNIKNIQCHGTGHSADGFAAYLTENVRMTTAGRHPPTVSRTTTISTFRPSRQEDVRLVIMSSPAKSCSLDPVPTFIVLEFVDNPAAVIRLLPGERFADAGSSTGRRHLRSSDVPALTITPTSTRFGDRCFQSAAERL